MSKKKPPPTPEPREQRASPSPPLGPQLANPRLHRDGNPISQFHSPGYSTDRPRAHEPILPAAPLHYRLLIPRHSSTNWRNRTEDLIGRVTNDLRRTITEASARDMKILPWQEVPDLPAMSHEHQILWWRNHELFRLGELLERYLDGGAEYQMSREVDMGVEDGRWRLTVALRGMATARSEASLVPSELDDMDRDGRDDDYALHFQPGRNPHGFYGSSDPDLEPLPFDLLDFEEPGDLRSANRPEVVWLRAPEPLFLPEGESDPFGNPGFLLKSGSRSSLLPSVEPQNADCESSEDLDCYMDSVFRFSSSSP